MDAKVWKYPDFLEQWKADKVVLGERREINTDVLIELIEEGAHLNPRELLMLLKKAAKENDAQLAKYLLHYWIPYRSVNKEIDIDINKIFLTAIEHNNCKVAREFIIYIDDINFDGGMPILTACAKGHLKMTKLLVTCGAKYGEGCLLDAVTHGKNPALVDYLVNDLKVPVTNIIKIQPGSKAIRIILNARTLCS